LLLQLSFRGDSLATLAADIQVVLYGNPLLGAYLAIYQSRNQFLGLVA
jgi:hypothetical protein